MKASYRWLCTLVPGLTAAPEDLAARFKDGMRRASAEVFTALDDDELRTYLELTERIAATVHDDAAEPLRRATA